MPLNDRGQLIALLDRLGSPDDAEALAAARAVDAEMKRQGLDWNTLLVAGGAANDDSDEPPGHVHADHDSATAPLQGDTAGDLAAIERLLASGGLSADTKEMLTDLKEDLKGGSFSLADRRYLQSLEARLRSGKTD